MFFALCELLDVVEVHLVFLPKYSPELNPCEEIFAHVKQHLCCYSSNSHFWYKIMKSLEEVSYAHVTNTISMHYFLEKNKDILYFLLWKDLFLFCFFFFKVALEQNLQ